MRDHLVKTMIIKNNVMIVDKIKKLYFEYSKKLITEFKNKIKKRIEKIIKKINSSEIVCNIPFFIIKKIISQLIHFQKEVNELSIQIVNDDIAKKAETNTY